MNLLEKTRQLNKLLQHTVGHSLNFSEMTELLRDLVYANMYVLSRRGKVLGYAVTSPFRTLALQQMVVKDKHIDDQLLGLLSDVNDTAIYERDQDSDLSVAQALFELFDQSSVAVIPVIGGGNRLGTLLLTRENGPFTDDDLILGEYGSTIVGMEILRMKEDKSETEARSQAVVQIAVGSLSFSELEAVEHIFEELDGKEGLLVASKIADRVGITRSVIVNALRKLESAGVIETRSLGMKGTYIKILNPKILQELERARV